MEVSEGHGGVWRGMEHLERAPLEAHEELLAHVGQVVRRQRPLVDELVEARPRGHRVHIGVGGLVLRVLAVVLVVCREEVRLGSDFCVEGAKALVRAEPLAPLVDRARPLGRVAFSTLVSLEAVVLALPQPGEVVEHHLGGGETGRFGGDEEGRGELWRAMATGVGMRERVQAAPSSTRRTRSISR